MATTSSLATAVNSVLFNNFIADDGAVARIRDGQAPVCTAFGNLSIPAGAIIDGIEIDMEGYAIVAGHDAAVGDWIYVSNDGVSWSTAQSITTGTWATSAPGGVETAGGTSELWGETWNATTAAAIQVKLGWGTTDGDAVYLDYVKVRITYTLPIDKALSINGSLTINGNLIIK